MENSCGNRCCMSLRVLFRYLGKLRQAGTELVDKWGCAGALALLESQPLTPVFAAAPRNMCHWKLFIQDHGPEESSGVFVVSVQRAGSSLESKISVPARGDLIWQWRLCQRTEDLPLILRFSADATRNGTCALVDTGRWAPGRSAVPARSSAPPMEGVKGRGGPHFNNKGQEGRDVIVSLWGQGEIHVSRLLSDWAAAGLQCYQQVAFAVVCALHATSVAVAVCLGTHAPPKVFPTVSFTSMWQCITSSLPQRGAPGFLQAAGIPPLCSVPGAGACAGSVPWLFPVRGVMWQ